MSDPSFIWEDKKNVRHLLFANVAISGFSPTNILAVFTPKLIVEDTHKLRASFLRYAYMVTLKLIFFIYSFVF